MVGEDGLIYALSCRTAGEVDKVSGEACYVARVASEGVSDADSYAVWDGERFTLDRTRAAPIKLPAGGTYRPIPPGQVSMAWNADISRYVMAYSPWPGWSEAINVRVAEEPWGPWSRATAVQLPGCKDMVDERRHSCYTASLQTFMDGPGMLGIGYYDSLADPTSGPGGDYIVSRVPIEVASEDTGGAQPE